MTGETRILVVDDHVLVSDALAERLRREPRLTVVGTADTADEAITKTIECRPDVILMDINMPGLNPFDAARTIGTLRPEARIIFLSAHINDRYIDQALEVKARGYLTKRESPDTVIEAINEVSSGGAYFSDEVRSRIVVNARGAELGTKSKSRISTLTEREIEVLRYLAHGMAKKEIARTMHIAVKTVDRHTANLMNKLDIHDRVELALFAIREGLAELCP